MDGEDRILAHLRHKARERRGAYVAQGRRFQALSNDALEARWAAAFVALCVEAWRESAPDLDDLSSEIGLRGRPIPAHLVQHLVPAVQESIAGRTTAALLKTFARRVAAFMRRQAGSLGKP